MIFHGTLMSLFVGVVHSMSVGLRPSSSSFDNDAAIVVLTHDRPVSLDLMSQCSDVLFSYFATHAVS